MNTKQIIFITVFFSNLINPNYLFSEEIKIGWIGAITGTKASPNQWEAAQIAVEDINNNGGINGKNLKLIAEDSQCNGQMAVGAIKKLIDFEGVKIVIGGHCSPESVPMASIAEAKKVLMIAAITTTPKLTPLGDYVFRLSPRNTAGAELLNQYLKEKTEAKKLAVIYEQTDYAEPPAIHLGELFKTNSNGSETVSIESFTPGTTDFRTLLTKVKSKNPDYIYLGAQGNDTVKALISQIKELQINSNLCGNEIVGATTVLDTSLVPHHSELIYAEPAFNLESSETKDFINKFSKKTGQSKLPFGIWTAEAYDAVMLTAKLIRENGVDPEKIKQELYKIHDYKGASGKIGFDKNGDGERVYNVKSVKDGVVTVVY